MMQNFMPLTKEKGYTLLFSVLVSSLVLAIGISILTISKKEFLIATSTRDSTSAFYAADGGLECGLFSHDQQVFDTALTNTNPQLACSVPHSAVTRTNTNDATNPPQANFEFHAKFGSEGTSCAVVTVVRANDSLGRLKTTISSRGSNTGWNSATSECSVLSARRVERGLKYSTF